MNRIHRSLFNARLGTTVAVPETASSQGKAAAATAPLVAASLLLAAGAAWAQALPTGGQVAAGQGAITRAGNTLTVRQDSDRLVTTWQSFDVGAGGRVQFLQPSAASAALARVLGGQPSTIAGNLQANGQLFLVNPAGVLFAPGAQVDAASLVASTLAMSDADFLAGRLRLAGDSTAAVVNQGVLRAATGGHVALVAARIVNDGRIEAPQGGALLGAGQDVTLDFGGSTRLRVDRGALAAEIANGGAVVADGGLVHMSARAAGQLASAVINTTGTVQARTLATGRKGEILLIADMERGTLQAGGRIDASAPDGGNGGFIETSGAHVATLPGLVVDAGAARGQGGQWLVDPYDYTINAAAATTIANALDLGTGVTVTTATQNAGYGSGTSGSAGGDITVASAIAKTSGGNASLVLRADRSIVVNAPITSTGGALDLTLSAANAATGTLGGVNVNANLSTNGGSLLIGGAGGSLAAGSTSNGIGYALNIDASAPAVRIGTNVSIGTAGGAITINGRSNATTSSYTGVRAGIYLMSGSTIDSGGGNINLSGISAADDKMFGFAVEGNSGTVTTVRTSSTSGTLVVDSRNTLDPLGALGLVNNGNQQRIQFWAPSVAHLLFMINGQNKLAVFTQSPPCNPGYPNCGTVVIPGGNQSYTSAGYNVKAMAMNPIYVTTGNGTKVYDGASDATGVGLSALGGPVGFTVGQLGSLVFRTASKNVGSYTTLAGDPANPVTYSAGGTSYAVSYFNQGTYSITTRALSNIAATDKVYDGTRTAAVTATGLVPGDNVQVQATGQFTQADVGSGITVNVTGVSLAGTDAGNYTLPAFSSLSTTASITPAPLRVTANDATKTYDGAPWSGGNGVTYAGWVNNEGTAVLSGTLAFGGAAQGATNAGSYALTASGQTAANYALTFVPGTLTVAPATLTYTATAASRTYGAANPALAGSVAGFVGSDNASNALTGTATWTTTATTSSNAGSYAISGGGLSANHGNYVFAQAAGNASALTVNRAPLAVTLNDAGKTYDGNAWSGGNGWTATGYVLGQGASVVGGTLSYGGTAQGAVNAGSYTLTGSGLTASNYTIGYTAGTLTVSPATLTYAATAASRRYGAANPTLGGTLTGFVGTDNASNALTGSASWTTTATSASNVGSYAINGGGLVANNGNYVFAQAAGNASALTVTSAPLTLTVNDATRTYDGGAWSGGNGYATSGWVLGQSDTLLAGTPAWGGAAQGARNAGSYALSASGLSAPNYAITVVPGTLRIAPATLTYTATAASRTYGAANPALAGSVAGFVGSDNASNALTGTATWTTTATTSSNAGSYAISGGGLSANHGNYVFVQAAGNASALTVNRAPLAVTLNDAGKTYDGNAWSGGNGWTATGYVLGQGASVVGGTLSYGGTAQGAVNAGSYTLTGSGLTASNYTLGYTAGTLTVSPAPLAYTATPASRVQGTANPALGGTLTGFVGTDNAAGTVTGTASWTSPATVASPVGRYAILGSGLTLLGANYVLVQAAGNATALAVTPDPATAPPAAPPAAKAPLQAPQAAQAPRIAPVPYFPDNAAPSLGQAVRAAQGASQSQSQAQLPAQAQSPAQGPSGQGQGQGQGQGPSQGQASSPAPASTGQPPAQAPAGNLNYIPVDAAGTPLAIAAPAVSALLQWPADPAAAMPPAGTQAASTPAPLQPVQPAVARQRRAAVGNATVAVPSADGPLDVFVIDGGVRAAVDPVSP